MWLQYSREELELPIKMVRFLLFDSEEDRVSLSWHLTNVEKDRIQSTFENDRNQQALQKLNRLIRKSR